MEYKFKINEFEGPLDLLLHLIKESEMDIMDIEIVRLTDQYLDYINNMEKMNLSVASEYLTVASELLYLKSRTLLPKENVEDESEEFILAKENLINRLLEYKQYKDVTSTLKILEERRSEFYTKSPSDLREYTPDEIINAVATGNNRVMTKVPLDVYTLKQYVKDYYLAVLVHINHASIYGEDSSYLIITDITDDGKLIVRDPNKSNIDKYATIRDGGETIYETFDFFLAAGRNAVSRYV